MWRIYLIHKSDRQIVCTHNRHQLRWMNMLTHVTGIIFILQIIILWNLKYYLLDWMNTGSKTYEICYAFYLSVLFKYMMNDDVRVRKEKESLKGVVAILVGWNSHNDRCFLVMSPFFNAFDGRKDRDEKQLLKFLDNYENNSN